MIYGFVASPFGRCIIGWSAQGILQLSFVDPGQDGARLSELRKRRPRARMRRDDAAARRLAARIFAWGGARGAFGVVLCGTHFQVRVWRALLRVPPGATVTYGELAEAAGSPGAARAVGSAMAANPIAVLVPCHRVVRGGGGLGGYRWGGDRKRALLDWESGRSPSKTREGRRR